MFAARSYPAIVFFSGRRSAAVFAGKPAGAWAIAIKNDIARELAGAGIDFVGCFSAIGWTSADLLDFRRYVESDRAGLRVSVSSRSAARAGPMDWPRDYRDRLLGRIRTFSAARIGFRLRCSWRPAELGSPDEWV